MIRLLNYSAVIIVLFVSGCSYTGIKTVHSEKFYASQMEIKWPAPPAKPRLEMIQVIYSTADFKKLLIEDTKTGKFVKWLIGEEAEFVDRFVRPYGVFAKNGKIFLVEQGTFCIIVLDTQKGTVHYLQITNDGDILFYPTSLTVDEDDNIYVCDPEKGRIVVYNDKGAPVKSLGANFDPWRPCGIAYNEKNKRFYVVDSANHEIKIFNSKFELITSFGKRGENTGEFNFPTHIFIDKQAHVYVTDSMNFRVQFFNAEGKYLGKVGVMGKAEGSLERPKGVCVDSRGHIYVMDSLKGSIQVFDRDDKFLMAVGEEGRMPGQFSLASGMFCDENDYIYVADTLNRRIQVLKYIGGDS